MDGALVSLRVVNPMSLASVPQLRGDFQSRLRIGTRCRSAHWRIEPATPPVAGASHVTPPQHEEENSRSNLGQMVPSGQKICCRHGCAHDLLVTAGWVFWLFNGQLSTTPAHVWTCSKPASKPSVFSTISWVSRNGSTRTLRISQRNVRG